MIVIITVLAGTLGAGCGSSSDEPPTTSTQSAAPEPAATADEWPEPKSDHEDRTDLLSTAYVTMPRKDSIQLREKPLRRADRRGLVGRCHQDDPTLLKDYLRTWKVILKYPDCFKPSDVEEARLV